MSVLNTELVAYASAGLPLDDATLTGGAIDLTRRPVFVALTGDSVIAAVSDGADTRNLTINGRVPGGAPDSEVLALTGAVEVVGATTFERGQSYELDATDGTRTVTITEGSAGPTLATIPPTEVGVYRLFRNSISAVGAVTRFEKLFFKNTNPTDTLLDAAVELTADPSARARIGCAPTQDDTATIANRLATPAGVTFVDDNVSQGVPGTHVAGGSAIGVWVEQALLAADPAFKTFIEITMSGATT